MLTEVHFLLHLRGPDERIKVDGQSVVYGLAADFNAFV